MLQTVPDGQMPCAHNDNRFLALLQQARRSERPFLLPTRPAPAQSGGTSRGRWRRARGFDRPLAELPRRRVRCHCNRYFPSLAARHPQGRQIPLRQAFCSTHWKNAWLWRAGGASGKAPASANTSRNQIPSAFSNQDARPVDPRETLQPQSDRVRPERGSAPSLGPARAGTDIGQRFRQRFRTVCDGAPRRRVSLPGRCNRLWLRCQGLDAD